VWGHEGGARIFQEEIVVNEIGSRQFTVQRTSIEAALQWLCSKEVDVSAAVDLPEKKLFP